MSRQRLPKGTQDKGQGDMMLVAAMQFADSHIPDMKKTAGKDYIPFGHDNNYPEYILGLYNKSAKHNAIVNGKCVYILGNGLESTDDAGKTFLAKANEKQTWNDLSKPICNDIENYGGVYLQVIPKRGGGYNVYHMAYHRLRSNEANTKFYYKKSWDKNAWQEADKTYPAFTPGITVTSVYYFKEYRSGKNTYALPSWVAACNWIESDIEVSKATLTNAKTGFSASKFINFYNGEPPELKKKAIEKRLENAATGSEGKKLLIGYNNDPNKKPTVDDLGASDLTKEDFGKVDELITGNIFAGHSVTHPLLFGIQQPGKLGSSQELRVAYDIFKNTYANAKQRQLEGIVKFFAGIAGVNTEIKIVDVDPISIDIPESIIASSIDRDEVREKMGLKKADDITGQALIAKSINALSPLVANKVLESMTRDEIRSLAGLSKVVGGDAIAGAPAVGTPAEMAVNEILTNLTGRQHQAIARIVKQFGQGKLTQAQATLLLKNGYKFTDEDVNAYLGIEEVPEAFSADDEMDIALAFSEHGEERSGFTIIKSEVFTGEEEEEMRFAFKTMAELTQSEKQVTEAIKKNPALTNAAIADLLLLSIDTVDNITKQLAADGIISASTKGGSIIRKVIEQVPKTTLPDIKVMYSYEKRPDVTGPTLLKTSRPFCVKMVGLSETKLFSRSDIQKISERLGYSVFKRAGGFWNNNGTIEYQCRHGWIKHVVIKKN